MGRIIRRTVTITITETWTITWTTDETSPPPASTVVLAQPTAQEEPDETLPTTLSAADPGESSASDPTTPPTPDGVSPTPDRQRKRTRRRRGAVEALQATAPWRSTMPPKPDMGAIRSQAGDFQPIPQGWNTSIKSQDRRFRWWSKWIPW